MVMSCNWACCDPRGTKRVLVLSRCDSGGNRQTSCLGNLDLSCLLW